MTWVVRRGREELGRYETVAEAKAAWPPVKPAYWRANNKGTIAEYFSITGGTPDETGLVLAPALELKGDPR